MTTGWLDWRTHDVGPARPCRICTRPAMCRDQRGRPCHKVCAETQPTATVAPADADALVIDLAAHRRRPTRRTA